MFHRAYVQGQKWCCHRQYAVHRHLGMAGECIDCYVSTVTVCNNQVHGSRRSAAPLVDVSAEITRSSTAGLERITAGPAKTNETNTGPKLFWQMRSDAQKKLRTRLKPKRSSPTRSLDVSVAPGSMYAMYVDPGV